MATRKKTTKSITELAAQTNQLENLYQVSLCIYSVHSEEELFSVLKNKLPNLCEVDFIECSYERKLSRSHSVYSYKCTRTQDPLYIRFCKQSGFHKQQTQQLKKICRMLENVLIRIERQQQLNNNKEQWELAFDTINTPLCLICPEGKILRTNKTFRQKTQMSKKELSQKDYFHTFFGRHKKHSVGIYEKIREVRYNQNGEKEFFEISIQEITQSTKHKIQLITLKDITKQIQIEEKVAKSAQSSELKIISSSIAHELNNPIGGIHMLLQTLQAKQNNTDLSKDIHEMLLAIQRCIQIIHQLLKAPSETCLKS